jgi:hypothetical protein
MASAYPQIGRVEHVQDGCWGKGMGGTGRTGGACITECCSEAFPPGYRYPIENFEFRPIDLTTAALPASKCHNDVI